MLKYYSSSETFNMVSDKMLQYAFIQMADEIE